MGQTSQSRMQIEDVRGLIGLAGIATQMTGSMFVLLLFVLLQRRARRDYFGWWTTGWALITVAIGAVALSTILTMRGSPIAVSPEHPGLNVLYAVYQMAKLSGVGCLLAGSAAYAGRPLGRLQWRAILLIFLAATLLSVAFLPGLRRYVAWQAPFAAPLFAASAVLLLRLPEPRRSFGSVATGLVFAGGAMLWAIYGVVFRTVPLRGSGLPATPGGMVVLFNTYLDFLLAVFLCFGMVVLLMEDAKREVEEAKRAVDDAHARLAEAHDRLRRSAAHDPLTGCLNRQGFMQHMAISPGAMQSGTVVVVDMDNLKEVNDRHGHPAGDAMLRHLAGVLGAAAPTDALLFRWGGDEFLILLPDTPPAEAEERFRQAILAAPALEFPGVEGGTCAVEASVGAARFARPEALDAAVRRADRGMYDHKQWRKGQTGDQTAILP